MTEIPVAVLQEAADLGLKLGLKPPDTLTVEPDTKCPPDFAKTLKAHKWALLPLLGLPFVMRFSQALGETIFFCKDEHTKSALIEADASEWNIYTCDELQILMAQNRIAPLTLSELNLLHEFKRTFNARIHD